VGISDFGGIPRSGAVGFVIGDTAYVGTGFNYEGNTRLKDFWKYDQFQKSWIQVASFPGPGRSNAVAFVMNNKAYVGTGTNDGLYPMSDFYEFDPANGANGTWRVVADLGYNFPIDSAHQYSSITKRYGAAAWAVSNRGFVGSGHNLSDLQDVWEFDPTAGTYGTWTQRSSFPGKKRQNSFVMVIKDKANNDMAYIGCGSDNNTLIRDFYKFDVSKLDATTGPWTALNSFTGKDLNGNAITQPKPRELASTFTINGMGYLMCGNTGGVNGETWQYNPETDTWIQQYSFTSNWPTAGAARAGAVGFALGNYGYLTTGGSGISFKFDDCWRFDPTGKEPDNY
jgi:N-acetylneuraminic acid mutarotase